jgi:hypothetical protein
VDRATWTDERLDDLSNRMDAGFERVDRDIRDLRSDMRAEIGGLRGEMRDEIGGLRGEMRDAIGGLRGEMRDAIGGLRGEMRDAIGGLRGELGGEIEALRLTILRTGGGIMIGLVGVIAAVFASGG